MSRVWNGVVNEDNGFTIRAQLVSDTWDGRTSTLSAALIVAADISSISARSYDKSTGSAAGALQTLTVATVIPSTTFTYYPEADEDVTEVYNFVWRVPATLVPDGDKHYQIEIVFTPASGEVFSEIFDIYTNPQYIS